MKNLPKSHQISDKLFSLFTNKAANSSSKCEEFFWQQATIPKCLLEKEIKETEKQK